MSIPVTPAQPIDASKPPPSQRRRRWWMVLLGLAFLALAGWYGGRLLVVAYHLRAADQALARYDYSEALGEYEAALRVWPYGTALRLKAARTARRGGQLERAEEYLSACEQAGVTSDTGLEREMLRAQQGDLAEVEADLRGRIFEEHPDSVLILEALAQGYIRIHRRREAIVLLSRDLLPRTPDHPDARFWLGSQLAEAGLIADAVPNYQRALQLAPHHTSFRLKLADALVHASNPGEAWPHFEELLRHSPDDPSVLLGAARCCRALGRYQAARGYLDTLLRDHADHAEAWAERGRVSREQDKGSEALRCLCRAFELAPYHYEIGFILLAELRGQQKTAEAEALGKKLVRLAEQRKRLRELTIQLNKPGRNAPGRYEIGMIHMNNMAEAEAEGWLLGAVQDDPGYRPAHSALAEYYQRRGKADVAEYHRRRAGGQKP
jgi:tetratricopeptide (TPR) repeat protein